MAKLRLIVWTVGTAVAAVLLLRDTSWPSTEDPPTAVMGVVRIMAGALAAYLLVATIGALRVPRLAPRFVRRIVTTAFGTALIVAPMTASAAPADDPAPIEAPVLRRVSDPVPEPMVAPPGPPVDHATRLVTAGPGDHLWALAEREVTARLGRAPTDAEVVPYWQQLIDANRDRLVTGDPDFIVPGQEFVLPS